jgi:hypothetical protein
MLKDRKRNYTAPLKITDEGRQQIKTREFVQNVHAKVSALVAMKVIHKTDASDVFDKMIAWAAAGNGWDSLPLLGDCRQLENFAHKHHAELQELAPELRDAEKREAYQRLLADSFGKDIGEHGETSRAWKWLN